MGVGPPPGIGGPLGHRVSHFTLAVEQSSGRQASSNQNWNLIPTSNVRGEVALNDLMKKGDVITPLGVPKCVMLKALFMFAKTFN